MTDTEIVVSEWTKELGYKFPPKEEQFLVDLCNAIEDNNTRSVVFVMTCKHLLSMIEGFNERAIDEHQAGYDEGYADAESED